MQLTATTWIYLIAIFFLFNIHSQKNLFSNNEKSTNNQLKTDWNYNLKIKENFTNKENFKLLQAFLFGDYKKINYQLKLKYRLLNLYHLFTPSGLHFTSALMLLQPMKLLFKTNGRKIYKIVFLIINIFTFFLPQLYPLKRIASINIFHYLISTKLGYTYFISFLVMSILDFLFGTFKFSYLSFTYSFLFLGVVLTTSDQNLFKRIVLLFGGIFLTGFFSDSPILVGAIFCNFILTSVFTLIFPIIFLLYWIPFPSIIHINEYLINSYNSLTIFFFNHLNILGYTYCSFFSLILFVGLSLKINYKTLKKIIVFSTLFHPVVLNFTYDPSNSTYFLQNLKNKQSNINIEPKVLIKTLYTDYGYKFIYTNSVECKVNFNALEFNITSCKRT